jgi:hypothetical protein
MKLNTNFARYVFSGILYPFVSNKLKLKNWKYPQKLMFTATRELTDMPLEVLVYSVVVVGQ